MVRTSPPAYEESSVFLSQAKDWSPGVVAKSASCVLESCRVVLASPSAGHEEQLDCLKWMAELMKFVPSFELETDLVKPFLDSVNNYLDNVIEIYEEVEADVKDEFIHLVNILLKLTIKVVCFVCDGDKSSQSDLPSLGQLLPLIQKKTQKKLGKLIFLNRLQLSCFSLEESNVQELKTNLELN